tara:strand:+ start:874 stop:1755 length:882 start_codon:yes stop_codon:yes gene_type:complete
MNIYLFGKTSLSGEVFYKYLNEKKNCNIYSFSREEKNSFKVDLKNPTSFSIINNNKFKIISFAPIWDLSYFLNYLFYNEKYKLDNLDGIIACSSTSAITKRFESNNFDKNLSSNLIRSEEKIIEIARKLEINCQIIRPTLIYGSIDGLKDKNISRILLIMRSLGVIILPSNTGLRQPIHAFQLAEVVYSLMLKSLNSGQQTQIEAINVGGDEIFDFNQMVEILKKSLRNDDRAKKCLILKIPNRLFFLFISPILIFSPKYFASLCRVCSNLSGFTLACDITKTDPKNFPLQFE